MESAVETALQRPYRAYAHQDYCKIVSAFSTMNSNPFLNSSLFPRSPSFQISKTRLDRKSLSDFIVNANSDQNQISPVNELLNSRSFRIRIEDMIPY